MTASLALRCCFSILLLSTAANAQTANVPEPAKWKRYTVKGEEFSATLPTLPSVTTTSVWVARTQESREQRTIFALAGGVLYAVYAYENPKPRQSLTDFIAEQTAKHRKDLVADRSVQVGGVTGREFTSLGANKKLTTEQFFATEQHLYKFGVYGASADEEGAKQFFASIVFGKKPEGIAVSEGPGAPLLPGSDELTYAASEVDQRARITERVPPDYTEEARKHKLSGTVILKVLLSSTGQVTNIIVASGLPYGLTERAVVAARQLRFTPAMKDGKPVSMWMTVEFNFNIY